MKNFIIIGAISMAPSCGNSEKEDNTEALTYQGRIVMQRLYISMHPSMAINSPYLTVCMNL